MDVDFNTGGNNPNVQRNSLGGVDQVAAGYQNGTVDFEYSALDFALGGGFDTGWGDFGVNSHATYYINYDSERSYGTGDIENIAGNLGLPRWRANVLFSWNMADWFASLNWDYIGSSKSSISDTKWDAWSQFNIQGGYDFGKYGSFTLGMNNMFNKGPILTPQGATVDEYTYPNVGLVYFVRYRIEM